MKAIKILIILIIFSSCVEEYEQPIECNSDKDFCGVVESSILKDNGRYETLLRLPCGKEFWKIIETNDEKIKGSVVCDLRDDKIEL